MCTPASDDIAGKASAVVAYTSSLAATVGLARVKSRRHKVRGPSLDVIQARGVHESDRDLAYSLSIK
jgi:hypothetical protein